LKRIVFLQHAWEDPPGYVGDLLDEYGIAYDVVQVVNEPFPELGRYAAVIGLGGFQQVYRKDLYPYLAVEKRILREAVARDLPYLGICLGGQILADLFEGAVQRHTTTEIGFFDVPLTSEGQRDPLYAGLPGYQKVFHWHEDAFELPAEAVLLATNEHAPNQAFRYGPYAYGLQYHIELNAAVLDTWLHHPELQEKIVQTLGHEGYTALEAAIVQHVPIYREHGRIMVQNFLKLSALI